MTTSPPDPAAPTGSQDTPTADDVRAGVIRSLSQVLRREVRDVDPATRLFEDLNLDSTSVLELLMVIEKDFGVQFDAEDLELQHFETIGSLSAFILTVVG